MPNHLVTGTNSLSFSTGVSILESPATAMPVRGTAVPRLFHSSIAMLLKDSSSTEFKVANGLSYTTLTTRITESFHKL